MDVCLFPFLIVFNKRDLLSFVDKWEIRDDNIVLYITNLKAMYFKQLADKVGHFKENEKGVAAMCKAMEDIAEGEG